MRYLLLVWVDETAEAAESPLNAVATWIDDVQGRGLRLIGGPLGPTSSSTVVHERGGKLLVTDGPFAESREWIGGFDVLECRDFEEALRAARSSSARSGASVCRASSACSRERRHHEVPHVRRPRSRCESE